MKHRGQHNEQANRQQHHRNVDSRESLGGAFGGRLPLTSLLHHPNHSCHQRLAGHTGRFDIDHRIEIQCPGEDRDPGLDPERHALTSDRALVDAGRTAANDPVDGYPLRRTNSHDVTRDDFFNGNFFFAITISNPPSHRRCEFTQRFDRPGRASHGKVFERVTECKKKKQNRGLTDPAHHGGPDRRQQHEQVDVENASHQFANGSDGEIGGRRQHREHIQNLGNAHEFQLSRDKPGEQQGSADHHGDDVPARPDSGWCGRFLSHENEIRTGQRHSVKRPKSQPIFCRTDVSYS